MNLQRRHEFLDESVHDVAERARRSALGFFAGTNAGWGRADLAAWLSDSYRNAVRKAPAGTGPLAGSSPPKRHVDETEVEALLFRTREDALELIALREWERPDFARTAVGAGLVVGVYDGLGGIGYVALARSRMTLIDRVFSLLIADSLTRPGDYGSLIVCDGCGEVSFEWERTHLATCEDRARTSCVVPRWKTSVGYLAHKEVG